MNRPNPFKTDDVASYVHDRSQRIDDLFEEFDDWFADEEPENFDDNFVFSLRMQYRERGELTDRQIEALESIVDSWCRNERRY